MLLCSKNLKDKFTYYNIKLNENKTSEWLNSIQGFYLNITSCMECNNRLYNFESFTTLNLNLTDENVSIVDMIKQIYKIEYDCQDWECEHCKKKTKNKKQMKLWNLPDVLFITINRFTDIMRKNNNPVNINENLNFNKGSILSNTDIEKKYKLSSIGLHIGSLNGGHYMAICNFDDNYYLYNDLSVKKIEDNNFLKNNSAAYMLVYNKL
jgi:ubiquitin C-terminal hydrolase